MTSFNLLNIELQYYFFTFARIGGAIFLLPGLGDAFTPTRVRVGFIFMLTLIFTPILMPFMPPPESELLMIVLLTLKELMIGLFLGFIVKLMMVALDVAGMVIANNTSLANASVFNPALSTQGSLPGILLGMTGIVLIFTSDLHHLFIEAILQSYTIFDPQMKFEVMDLSEGFLSILSDTMVIGFKICAPVLVIGLLFFISLGLLARLMPQLQIFFISIPIQILLGFSVFMITISGGLLLWLNRLQDKLSFFIENGGL